MSKHLVTLGLVGAMLLQLTVLAGEYLSATYPLWSGQEVRLQTRPVDPRSLFRGNYARLAYDINRVPASSIENHRRLRHNEVVYVSLQAGEDGLQQVQGVSLDRPGSGLFIRGRFNKQRSASETLHISYGIDAWFAPRDKAIQMEHELRDNAVAVVMVAANGKAALKQVISTSGNDS